MKKNNIFTFLDEIEKSDETLKKWGDLYRIEEKIIETLVSARKNKGLSQKEVADITGLKQPAIARIENNVNSPQLDTLIKLVDALDLKIEIRSINCREQIVDSNTFQEIVDEIHTMYSRGINGKQVYYTSEYKGGYTSENNKHEYPCKENHPA